MLRRLRHFVLLCVTMTALCALLMSGVNAYTYPSMPGSWSRLKVTIGDVTLPLANYPDGATFSPEESTMTVEEQKKFGFNVGGTLDLKGWECMGFARYVYAALFYKYPQDASIDTSLAAEYSHNYAYRNMIEEVLGSRTLSGGYSASTLKKLMTACLPGAVMRCGQHSMVLMAIFDDGILIYDANFSSTNEVNVRKYTWQGFVDSLGGRGIQALQMPAYHPGFSYSTGYSYPPKAEEPADTEDPDDTDYKLDTAKAGQYVVSYCTELNVRKRPTTSSTKVGTLKAGTVIQVGGFYGEWASITYKEASCWVHTDYLRKGGNMITVTFDLNGGEADFTSRSYEVGEKFEVLPDAAKANRTLVGWPDGSKYYTEDSTVPSSALTLKAQWVVIGFTDVPEGKWFSSYVESAYERGLISRDSLFRPDDLTSRAQMITVLGREYENEVGKRVSGGENVFSDVSNSSYYVGYVAWGKSVGLVKGISETVFDPNANVTREQIAEFLYRLAIYTGYAVREEGNPQSLERFGDRDNISNYAKAAICWAVDVGILKGDNAGNVNPKDPARRCEMVTMFSRYADYISFAKRVTADVTATQLAQELPVEEPAEAEQLEAEELQLPETASEPAAEEPAGEELAAAEPAGEAPSSEISAETPPEEPATAETPPAEAAPEEMLPEELPTETVEPADIDQPAEPAAETQAPAAA